jgi:hypothetical protein
LAGFLGKVDLHRDVHHIKQSLVDAIRALALQYCGSCSVVPGTKIHAQWRAAGRLATQPTLSTPGNNMDDR